MFETALNSLEVQGLVGKREETVQCNCVAECTLDHTDRHHQTGVESAFIPLMAASSQSSIPKAPRRWHVDVALGPHMHVLQLIKLLLLDGDDFLSVDILSLIDSTLAVIEPIAVYHTIHQPSNSIPNLEELSDLSVESQLFHMKPYIRFNNVYDVYEPFPGTHLE